MKRCSHVSLHKNIKKKKTKTSAVHLGCLESYEAYKESPDRDHTCARPVRQLHRHA